MFCLIKLILLSWNVKLDDKAKMAFCKSFLNHIKRQSQPYLLDTSSIHSRHYRTRSVSVRSLTIEVLFVRLYITKTFIKIEIMVSLIYMTMMRKINIFQFTFS